MTPGRDDVVSELVDLTGADLLDLQLHSGDSVLGRSLARLLHDVENPADALAGFQSSV